MQKTSLSTHILSEATDINNIIVKEPTIVWIRPQRDLLTERDIFSAAWLFLQEWKENSAHILWLVCDALACDEVWQLYLDDLWSDDTIKNRFHSLRSHKYSYNEQQYNTILKNNKEKLFDDNTTWFCEYIVKKIEKNKHSLEHYQYICKNATTQIKSQLKKEYTKNPRIEELTKIITDITKSIKKLDPRLNKDYIMKLETKKETAKQELYTLQNTTTISRKKTIINTTEEKTTIEGLQKSISGLQKILAWKDKKSELFLELKEEFIKNTNIDITATSITKHTIYTQQEQVFMEHIKTRFIDMLQKHKITPTKKNKKSPTDIGEKNIHDPQYKKAMLEYTNSISLSKSALLHKIDLSEHMISAIGELLQMQLLETELKKYNKDYIIEVKKAPIIDDLRSNTDCLIKISGWKVPKNEVYYHAVDLKTSANDQYIGKEKKTLSGITYLPGTARALDIDTISTTNTIMEINPSITYAAMATLLTQLWRGSAASQQNNIDPTIYSNIHTRIAQYQNKDTRSLLQSDALLQLRPQMRHIFEQVEEVFGAA